MTNAEVLEMYGSLPCDASECDVTDTHNMKKLADELYRRLPNTLNVENAAITLLNALSKNSLGSVQFEKECELLEKALLDL